MSASASSAGRPPRRRLAPSATRLPDGSASTSSPAARHRRPRSPSASSRRTKLTLGSSSGHSISPEGAEVLPLRARARNVPHFRAAPARQRRRDSTASPPSSLQEGERVITCGTRPSCNCSNRAWCASKPPPNLEGGGEITMRDLVKNCLRMRRAHHRRRGPRPQAFDLLQAMNTGRDGSIGARCTPAARARRQAASDR